MSSAPKTKEERRQLIIEQLLIWTNKLKDELDKNALPDNLTYIVQYSSAVWQHAKVLQKSFRGEDDEKEAGGEKQV